MKVISKDLAFEVAKSITSDLWDSIQKERDVFNYMVESIVKNNTPDEIKKLSIALKFIPQIFPVPSVIVNFATLSKKIEKITL